MSRPRAATKHYRVTRGVRPGDIIDLFALGLAQTTPGFTVPITLPHHESAQEFHGDPAYRR